MEFDLKRQQTTYSGTFSKHDRDVVLEFAKRMKHEFGDFIKAIVLFGSATKSRGKTGDVDVLVVLDDLSFELSAEFVETYRIITEKVIAEVSDKLHITSLKYVTFWNYVRDANPIAVNILRDGVALLDTGFFAPLQALLRRGEIKPTVESIWGYFSRSSAALNGSKGALFQGALDLYWAVVDASQAILMRHNIVPPSPEHVSDLILHRLVPNHILTSAHADTMKEFYTLSRLIMHNQIKHLSGKEYDEYYKKAYDFVTDVKKELEKG